MERRELGQTGQMLSVIGFGAIIVTRQTPAEADQYVGEAIDAGINYFDVAPSYGNAEERLGPAIEPYRDQIFLACKTQKRTRDEASLELRQSLARLKTDHIDLYQLHALSKPEDVEVAFGPGGCMELFEEARTLGLVRYLGFSAHSEEAGRMALERFGFDSVLFPVNYWGVTAGGFGQTLLEAAKARGAGRLALKAIAHCRLAERQPERRWHKAWYQPLDDPALSRAAVRWSLAQDITAAVTPGHIELMRLAVEAVQDLAPPTPAELALLAAGLPDDRQPIFPA